MSDLIEFNGMTLKPLNLFCMGTAGTTVYQAYESPLRYNDIGLHGCNELCHLDNQPKSCLITLGKDIRAVCGASKIIWRKLNE